MQRAKGANWLWHGRLKAVAWRYFNNQGEPHEVETKQAKGAVYTLPDNAQREGGGLVRSALLRSSRNRPAWRR